MPWFPFFLQLNHLFRFACPFSVLRYRSLSACIAPSCSLTLPILLSLLLFFLLSHLRSFLGEASWFGKFSLLPLSQSPSQLALFLSLLLQCYSRSRPHDEEQGTMGAFSGPLRGPLPLLYDLSPSLAYILVHRHASTKGPIQWKQLIVITSVRGQIDHYKRRITITDFFKISLYFSCR